MLPKVVVREFIEKFMKLDGCKVNIQIKHCLYGNQKLNKCTLRPFVDEECIGFIADDGGKKYIAMDELLKLYIDNVKCVMKSDVTTFELLMQ